MAKMTKTSWQYFPNFLPTEFKCACGCVTSVVDMDYNLLMIAQYLRNKYKRPVTISSGYRCQKYNDSLKGSVKNSYHVKKKAMDFYIPGYCDTLEGRKGVMADIKAMPGFKYTYCNENGSHPNMGNVIHVEVV